MRLTWTDGIAVQRDGKVLVAGDFTTINGVAQNRIARLNLDGSVDSTFAVGTGFNGAARWVLVEPSGKVIVGGEFLGYNGAPRIMSIKRRVARSCAGRCR